ncbi:Fructosyl amino acid oxidase [Aspergillus sclerotialis]|uniref:Fructosyl amino acid oxidase n=1 Tax=Aspergillus sclerotialis TaxID=2070753 RepID=A0A3A2ZFA2_9EURO|nr:Fructosyl amino acid oxidase [Aspergillus sclerotialis]
MENPTSPSHTRPILIIGAGVFGLSTALELSSRGYRDITVLDRYAPPVPDGSKPNTQIQSILSWRRKHERLEDTIQRLLSPHRLRHAIRNLSHPYIAKALEINHAQGKAFDEFADGNGLKRLYPDLRGNYGNLHAYHNTEGGWADAEGSIRYLSYQCTQAGVSFITEKRGTVLSLRREGSQIVGVTVSNGEFIPASMVILCTGAWSNLLLDLSHAASASGQPIGFIQLTPDEARSIQRIPVMINLSSGIFVFPPHPGTNILKVARHSYGFATSMRRYEDGKTVSSPKRDSNNADRSFLPEEADKGLRDGLQQLLPEFANHPWLNRRLCWYTDTPEGDFVIDYHPVLEGLFVATGGAGHAFKFLPILGRYVADRFEGRLSSEIKHKWRLRLPEGEGKVKIGDGSRAGPPLRVLTMEEQSKL